MYLRSLVRRRPSAPLVISVVALFVALGGVGYAATFLPAGSVGTAQLQPRAVTNHKLGNQSVGNWKLGFGAVGSRKIQNGAVGARQINSGQVQARVAGTCATAGQAISAVSQTGTVTCAKTAPSQFGAATKDPVTIDSTKSSTQILADTLPSGSPYLLFAAANATVTGSSTGQWVKVSCTLAPGGTAPSQTYTASVHVGEEPESVTIPLTVPAPSTTSNATASLNCAETHASGSAPTVAVAASVNALQTAGNN
jgi:hypothetical protein